MLEPLFEFLSDSWDTIKPYHVVREFEAAVVLRWGKFKRELTPGFHWKYPFAEEILDCTTVPNIVNLNAQSLVTKDGKFVTISAVVCYKIHNVQKALLKIQDVNDAVIDACYGVIGTEVAPRTFAEVSDAAFAGELRERCHKRSVTFGVTIDSVAIDNLTEANSLRIFGIES